MAEEFIEGEGGVDPFDPEVQADAQAEAQRLEEQQEVQDQQKLDRVALAYRRLFSGTAQDDDANIVMLDLAQFCRGFTSTFDENGRQHARLEGRREAFQRVLDFSRLDRDTLMRLYLSAATQ